MRGVVQICLTVSGLVMRVVVGGGFIVACRCGSVCNQINLLKPTGHVIHHQYNIQQLYALPTLYLCVLCVSENKQRLVPLTA